MIFDIKNRIIKISVSSDKSSKKWPPMKLAVNCKKKKNWYFISLRRFFSSICVWETTRRKWKFSRRGWAPFLWRREENPGVEHPPAHSAAIYNPFFSYKEKREEFSSFNIWKLWNFLLSWDSAYRSLRYVFISKKKKKKKKGAGGIPDDFSCCANKKKIFFFVVRIEKKCRSNITGSNKFHQYAWWVLFIHICQLFSGGSEEKTGRPPPQKKVVTREWWTIVYCYILVKENQQNIKEEEDRQVDYFPKGTTPFVQKLPVSHGNQDITSLNRLTILVGISSSVIRSPFHTKSNFRI